jgi:hypothetical protein
MSVSVSLLNVEKVLNPPQKPTVQNKRAFGEMILFMVCYTNQRSKYETSKEIHKKSSVGEMMRMKRGYPFSEGKTHHTSDSSANKN